MYQSCFRRLEEKKEIKIYRESAAVVFVDEAAVVADRAAVVGGAAVVVATVDIFAPSCELGLTPNLSLNLYREGIFNYDPKIRYLELFLLFERG